MEKKTFVIHRITEKWLPRTNITFKTSKVIVSAAGKASMQTSIKLKNKGIYKGFKIADMNHEKIIEVNGVWGKSFIRKAVKSVEYKAYYNLDEDLFISNIRKNIALSAINRLKRTKTFKFPVKAMIFSFPKIDKFAKIIPSIIDITNVQIEIKDKTGRIRQATFSGNELAKSHYVLDIEDYIVKSICISVQHDNKNLLSEESLRTGKRPKTAKSLKVKISGNGWIYFYEDCPLPIRLGLILFIVKIFRKQKVSFNMLKVS